MKPSVPLRLFLSLCLLFVASFTRADDQLGTAQLAASSGHALALRSDGTVWSWGTNRIGEVGTTNNFVLYPQRISGLSSVAGIAAGPLHSLAVQSNGMVWAWGTNGLGQLGTGYFLNSSNPVLVVGTSNVVSVAAGVNHSLAVLANGGVLAWGANNGGQLGTGNNTATNRPVLITSLSNVVAVAGGSNFSLALTTNGEVWSWGTNNTGQLGLGSTSTQLTPIKIATLSNIVQISAGHSHALARDNVGNVFAWGRNLQGELGNGTLTNSTSPKLVSGLGPTNSLGAVRWVSANFNSSAAVTVDGRLFYWGFHDFGWSSVSGMPPHPFGWTNGPMTTPSLLGAGADASFVTVAYGQTFLLVSDNDGSVWAWGNNNYAQWGTGPTFAGQPLEYDGTNPRYCFSPKPKARVTRFNRGNHNQSNQNYNSFVLPVGLQPAIELAPEGSELYNYPTTSAPWFLRIAKTKRQHALQLPSGSTNFTRFNVENPLVTFGSSAGAGPLYVNEPETFAIFAGAYDEKIAQTNMIRISVFDRGVFASGATNIAPTNIFYITMPRRYIASESNTWTAFMTNGYRVVVQTNGLRTEVEFIDRQSDWQEWDINWLYTYSGGQYYFYNPDKVVLGGYRLKHTADPSSTNYYYLVEAMGSLQVGTNTMAPLATTNGAAGITYAPMYALDFEQLPAWRSHFIDQAHFNGIPLPPTYSGRSEKELSGLLASITNNVVLTNSGAFTNLDDSPELRQHPILDRFVEDMGRDPLALASYVQNEVALVDPIAHAEARRKINEAVELGGVARSALGTFLEGQGSPAEQCALLVYLLRRAGYSAAYVFPTNSNLRLLDTRLSQLWRMQVKGIVWSDGAPVATDSLIIANYPWVVANIGTNCVHIFPWLKDTEIVEGLNIYDYLPANYPTAYSWIKDFAFSAPSLMSLAPSNSSPALFWKKYLEAVLSTNRITPNLSLDSFGVKAFNRRNEFRTWDNLPKPNFLTNQSQVAILTNFSASPVTFPFLTNYFDRIQVQVFKTDYTSTNLLIDSGEWRVCDLYNRKLLLFTQNVNQVTLYLAPYRTSITNQTNFSNFESGTNSLLAQQLQTSVATSVTELPVQLIYKRRVAYYGANSINAVQSYSLPSFAERPITTTQIPCRKAAMTALVFTMGKVSTEMLRVHADAYWKLESQRAMDPYFTPARTEDKGTAATLIGMGFFERADRDNELNAQLHKITTLSTLQVGRAAITPTGNKKMQIGLSMYWNISEEIANGSLHETTSGDSGLYDFGNYLDMGQLICPAAEHGIINTMFDDPMPISAVRLLQIAADRSRESGKAFPLEVTVKNYQSLGNKTYTGYGQFQANVQDYGTWGTISDAFTTWPDTNFLRVLVVPGLVDVNSANFTGSGALYFDRYGNASTITTYVAANTAPLNGGLSSYDFVSYVDAPSDPSYQYSHSLNYDVDRGFSFSFNDFGSFSFSGPIGPWSMATLKSVEAGTTTIKTRKTGFTPQQVAQANIMDSALSLSADSSTAAYKTAKGERGWNGSAYAATRQQGSKIFDPVQVAFGDFYSDTVDLALAGPMPLQLRRSYMSRGLADNQLGFGWHLGFLPWLVLSTNSAGQFIHGGEMDGSVIAYHFQSNNLWTVEAQYNPTLANFTDAGMGALVSGLQNRIEKYTTNGTLYVLSAPDGTKRFYQERTNFALITGTNRLDRVRPYLTRWEDHAGNYFTFQYGTNSTENDFGQLSRVESSSGPFLALNYDYFGRVVEVLTDDNRRARYTYDQYGDLVTVRLPDDSVWNYEYEHYTFNTNSSTYTDSDHLLIRETKPNGRIVANTYDSLRRVIAQAATVGTNRELVTNAWFFYTNNCTSLTNEVLSGATRVEDVFHNAYVYFYTNNFITKVVDPLGRVRIQDWFDSSETNKAGYYPNSVELIVDARGLTNEFRYDNRGNLTNRVTRGDLTGDGVTTQTATNTFTYTNDLPATVVSANGNRVACYYDSVDSFLLTRVEHSSANGIGIATNRFFYTNVSEVISMGWWSKTNSSFGLLARAVKADVATNEWAYNGRGFVVQSVQYAATADYTSNTDPAVTNFFIFSPRGDLAEQSDLLGRRARMSYDSTGKLEWREVLDQSGTVLGRESFYYNRNGELEWYDGPRSGPEDYVWFEYDGAGRKTQEIHWRSRAKSDGTGVEAETGDDLYATTFYSYDPFGNLTTTRTPNGTVTTNSFDALGRLTAQRAIDVNSVVLTSQGIAYEAGDQIAFQTNALGGVTERQYTTTGQLKYQKNPDGSTNRWRYYVDGRVSTNFLSNGAYWQSTYDDANRTVTRTFFSASALPLATNVFVFDRRGNVVRFIDAGGNSFTNVFDGLNRLKASFGPAIASDGPANLPNPGGTPLPVQQAITNFYGIAGVVQTNANALGEKVISYFDALSRPTRIEVRNAANAIVREASAVYSADHHSVTITNGSGSSAIVTTTFTDTEGQPILSIGYPSAGVREFARRDYDSMGNAVFEGRYSATNQVVSLWSQASSVYDGLNRQIVIIDRDNAVTTNYFDPLGNLTNRVLPGGLTWQAQFNSAGQLLKTFNLAGGLGTRTNAYTYYTSGPFIGALQTSTDGRGVTCTRTYDDFFRPATNTLSGTSGEHNQTLVSLYDARGLLTNVTESFADSSFGPATSVRRRYDPYGQLVSEGVLTNSVSVSIAAQTWNSAGRRSALSFGLVGYSFGWQADGQLSGVSVSGGGSGSSSYSYTSAGLFTSRTGNGIAVSFGSRDGTGRVLSRTTTLNATNLLQETLAWTGDGLLAAHTLARPDFTDTRSYDFVANSRRLGVERLQIDGTKGWTNVFQYDEGTAGGAGVLTKVAEPQTGGSSWSADLDIFNRIDRETNNVIRRLASGRMNASNSMATLTVRLDGRQLPFHWLGDGDGSWPTRWQAMMELRPGTHTLQAEARHSSGMFTTNRTSTFTNNAVDQTTLSHFAEGQLSYRVWKNSLGQTNRIQTFTWDGRGRLIGTTEIDSANNGYQWRAVYDAFGRRLQTITIVITNNVALTNQPKAVASYFDPEREFLELGLTIEGHTSWKLCGPDLDGSYGGMNGTGGFEGVLDDTGVFHAAISDARGNVLAENSPATSTIVWTDSRPTGYGAVPEYRPVALVQSRDIAVASAWRGRWADLSGLYWMGARYYDPVAGRFISCDPLGHDADPSLYAFANGDPINYFDPDGRIGKMSGNPNMMGDFLVLDENNFPIGGTSEYDQFYLRDHAGARSIRHDPLLRTYMPITDWPSINGRSFRMVFGGEAAAFGEAAVMIATSPLGMLAEVAESSAQAGEASVTGKHRGFAYTRAAVAIGSGALMLYSPVRGTVENTYSSFGGARAALGSSDYVATLMGKAALQRFNKPDATLGIRGGNVWVAPLEDYSGLATRSDVVTATGHAPGVLNAYLRGERMFGLAIPKSALSLRVPVEADASTSAAYRHWRPGGVTGVEHNGVWTSSGVREFVTDGGNAVPPGSVLFEFNSDGSWTVIRRF